MITLRQTAIAAAFAALSVASAPALADCEGCVSAINNANHDISRTVTQQGTGIIDTIINSTRSVLQAMGNATDAISKNASANNKQRGDDAQRIAKAQAKQQAATQAQESVADMSCSAVSSTLGTSTTTPGGSGDDFNTASSALPDRLKRAINATGASTTPSLPPGHEDDQLSDLGVGSCEAFASGPRAALCEAAGVKVTNPAYPDADVRAATLFDGPQAAGQATPLQQLTVPQTGAARDARKSYVVSIGDVTPPPNPTQDAARTPAFKAYLGALSQYKAVESLAQQPAASWDAWTTRDPSTVDAISAIADDPSTGPGFLRRYAKEHGITSYKDGVSPAELMNIEIERRVGNKDWVLNMAKASAEAKQAESLLMQAYSMRIEFERLKQEKRNAVLFGQVLHALNQQTSRERVDELAAVANGGGVVQKTQAH